MHTDNEQDGKAPDAPRDRWRITGYVGMSLARPTTPCPACGLPRLISSGGALVIHADCCMNQEADDVAHA